MTGILYQYNQDDIQFNGVKEPGISVQNDIITTNNNYIPAEHQPNVIESKKYNIINAIDIDWNSADIKLINKSASINTSGQMLKLYRDGINTSYDLANSAYNLAQTAIEANNIDKNTISQIKSILSDGVISSLREPISSFYKHVEPDKEDGNSIKLGYISKELYIPINIEFNNNEHEVDFGISYNNIDEHIIDTVNLKIKSNNEESYIPVYSKIENAYLLLGINKSDIPSANYTAGDSYININNNKISLNEDAILSYLKTTELNKNYYAGNGINISKYNDKYYISTSIITMEGIKTNNTGDDGKTISISISKPENNSYLKFVDEDKKLAVDIDAVKAYIGNSGQGVNYTAGSYINIINNVISAKIEDISNYVKNGIAIPDTADFVKYIGEQSSGSTINLAGINDEGIYKTNASTDGNDIYVSSDRRLKDNILDITEGEVERLFETESGNMHYFEWKENHKPSFGFIAQELIGFAPEAVTSDSEYMQVNYNAALTKTCAALFKKIKQLEERIKILEGES